MIESAIKWLGAMPISTSLIISAVVYLLAVFSIAVCNEIYQKVDYNSKRKFINSVGTLDLSCLLLHLFLGIAAFFWFLLIPIAVWILLVKVCATICSKTAKAIADRLIRFFKIEPEKGKQT